MADLGFIEKLVLKNGTELKLEEGQIVVLVGPNNSGKTTVLREIDKELYRKRETVILDYLNLGGEISPEMINPLLRKYGSRDKKGAFWKISGVSVSEKDITDGFIINLHKSTNQLNFNDIFLYNYKLLFAFFLTVQQRLDVLNNSARLNRDDGPATPLQHLEDEEEIEARVCNKVRAIFGTGVAIDRIGDRCNLHYGNPPKAEGDDKLHVKYYKRVSKLPKVADQGAGVQAFVGLLLYLVTSPRDIMLIDEPDAFLHPPQAFEAARMFAELCQDRQLFFATHNSHFLRGLVQAAPERVKVIRLDRKGNTTRSHEVKNEIFVKFANDPILKFTNCLEGIFFHAVVLCESEADCLFYRAMLDAIDKLDSARPVFWLGVNGKQNLAKTVLLYKALGVRVLSIADFDIFDYMDGAYESHLRPYIEAHGLDWKRVSELYTKFGPNTFPAKEKRKSAKKASIEITGRGDDYNACRDLIEEMRKAGAIVNRHGELESLCKSVNGKGADWVGAVLERYAGQLSTSKDLSKAREFAEEIAKNL